MNPSPLVGRLRHSRSHREAPKRAAARFDKKMDEWARRDALNNMAAARGWPIPYPRNTMP